MPVIKLLSSDARNKAALAISSARPIRPNGTPIRRLYSAGELAALRPRTGLDPVDEGLLLVVAEGKVSSDSTKIETTAGEGLTSLTWLGVRPKPP